jgi:Leucine-rich repeat (LRR) protein
VSPPAALTPLTSLDLRGCTQLSDVSPLAALTSLTTLNLERCTQLSDVSPLTALTHLEELILTRQDVDRLTIPSSMKKKVKVWGQGNFILPLLLL